MTKDFWFSLLGFMASAAGFVLLAGGIWLVASYLPARLNTADSPEETWTCAKRFGDQEEVAWRAKAGSAGIRINVEAPEQMEFFSLSCMPAKGGGCRFTDVGWGSVDVEVSGPSGKQTISFARNSPDVDDSYRHHATVYGDLARSIIAAFRAGTSARVLAKDGKGKAIHATQVNLDGFGPALDKCLAIWAAPAK
jgi:hypothetical protein